MTTTPALSPNDELCFLPFDASHLAGALRLSQEAGWPHRAEDWALTLSVSQGVVALAGGEVVGTALCSVFGDVAAMNMIIVDARMRGRGIGRSLMTHILALGGARELRLVGTADGLPLYEKLGFVTTGQIVQHQGIVQGVAPVPEVVAGGAYDLDRLAEMDLAASGMTRRPLISSIATAGDVLMAEQGFGVLRTFGRGRVLGPVIAADIATARALIAAAAHRCQGQFLRLDMPKEHELSAYVETFGLQKAGGGTVMHMAQHPTAPPLFHTYALVSQAFG